MRSKVLSGWIPLVMAVAFAAPLRADNRIIPPAVTKIWPVGMQRGATATFTLDGRNLSDIKAVIFDVPGIAAKVTQITDIRAHEGGNYFACGGAPPVALPPAFTDPARICVARLLIVGCTSGMANTLSHHRMASSCFPPNCNAEASRTMYAGSGRELVSTALWNAAAAASYFLRVRFARPMTL